MKIGSLPVQQPYVEGKARQSLAEAAIAPEKKGKMKFFEVVQNALKEEVDEKVRKLLEDIDAQGGILARHPNAEELNKYKALIKEFLQEVVSVYQVKYDSGSSWGYRNRTYVLIDRVNQVNRNLEMLTMAVLDAEAEPINLVEKTDEIKGLLVDLLV